MMSFEESACNCGYPWGPLAVSVSVALVARILERRRPRRRSMQGLDPGVTLFTSDRCPGCDPVRSRLIEVLGADGFREIKWTEHARSLRHPHG